MDGIELALRFSYMPNALHFCGPKQAGSNFLHYLKHRDNATAVNDDLRHFEGLYTYLAAIAEKAGKPFTDYGVVEAYWIGNSLLDMFSSSDMKALILALTKRGLPAAIAENRVQNLPAGARPHHNFNVLFVGVGQITGAVETTIGNMNSCMTADARVKEVMTAEKKLVVARRYVEHREGRLILSHKEKETEVSYLQDMMPDIRTGDRVALHWEFAAAILDRRQRHNLEKYTRSILAALSAKNYPLATASA